MPKIKATMRHESGIPLGGLGTGSVEVRPDGYFHEWQIFNLGLWAPRQPEDMKGAPPDVPANALSFYVWTRQGGGAPVMRRLGMASQFEDLYALAWLKSVESITFNGRYPVARLTYHDADLPVEVEATLFSPFVPHDARTSGTPGFYAVFQVRNRTRSSVDVSILATAKNSLALGAADRKLTNSVTRAGQAAFLTLRTDAEDGWKPTHGSVCLSAVGGRPSWIAGEYARHFQAAHRVPHSQYGAAAESLLFEFRETGVLPNSKGNTSPTGLVPATDEAIDALSQAQCAARCAQLKADPFVAALIRRLTVTGNKPANEEARRKFLKEIGYRIRAAEGEAGKIQAWGDAALASSVRLGPRQARELAFTFSWHFPLHFSAKGNVLGHAYENWFEDAEAVNRFMVKNAGRLRILTTGFADTLFDTNLDGALAEAWSAQLSTLAKCTWWTKNGDFAVWEGLGCCGFHTTDITYQGSFGIVALFPELQKSQMEMGARFQREDGRVHHFFTPDLSCVDQGFDRVDMNQQFVLLVCRDYLWTGDRDYLKRLWPNIVKAMESIEQLDKDGDGLPDHDTRRNTYDGWDFYGTPAYIASLWLAALKAAIRLAEETGEAAASARWQDLLERGVSSFEARLWNGQYYSLWVDGKTRDECCMTDQIDGEWFTRLIGLGNALPAARVSAALRAVMQHNYREEDGLINASYPPGRKPRLCTYNNFQARAPWTGIEYAIASMLMDHGMPDDGLKVVRNIHKRYLRAGRFWNHVECGGHYYRAMSSWAVLLSATGFQVDVSRGSVRFAPAFGPKVRAPWVAATGWGTFVSRKKTFELRCTAGSLQFGELALRTGLRAGRAVLNGRRGLPIDLSHAGGCTVVSFRRPVALKAGDTLVLD